MENALPEGTVWTSQGLIASQLKRWDGVSRTSVNSLPYPCSLPQAPVVCRIQLHTRLGIDCPLCFTLSLTLEAEHWKRAHGDLPGSCFGSLSLALLAWNWSSKVHWPVSESWRCGGESFAALWCDRVTSAWFSRTRHIFSLLDVI